MDAPRESIESLEFVTRLSGESARAVDARLAKARKLRIATTDAERKLWRVGGFKNVGYFVFR